MRICVLQPDYSTTGVDYKNYDPPRDLSHLLPGHQVDHVLLNKLTTYKQLKALGRVGYDVFVNLCEGYLEWEVPSIDVIQTLEALNLPFTGPSSLLYDPPKELMKYVAYCVGVDTPPYVLIRSMDDISTAMAQVPFPMFIKPAKAGDSLGIDTASKVMNEAALREKVGALLQEYDELLAEAYIDGREFTVLVAANAFPENSCTVLEPVEYIFPEGTAFKTYALKTSELHPDANVPVKEPALRERVKTAAQQIFTAFNGVGYARLDLRYDAATDRLYFLEINFTCSVFYQEGYEGSADHILRLDGLGQEGFLRHIIAEGIERHRRKQRMYEVRGNAIAGYGIYAKASIPAGTIIFKGEGRPHRVITRNHVMQHWKGKQLDDFERYAYPLSSEVFLLWDEDPSQWAPQNHSCDPNTGYRGLDVYSLRDIAKGEELTLDYASFLDEHMQPFECRCGSALCRRHITGIPLNSVTEREKRHRS